MSLVIETKDLWRVYRSKAGAEVPALRGVNLDVEAGAFVALKGRSGSGKTTLLNCLAGLDKPTSGSALVLGHDLLQMSDQELTVWRREQIGLVFQSFGLLPTLSAYENIELLLRIKGDEHDTRHKRALECLEIVGLGKWKDHRPFEMSGGQQQRVAIARAIVGEPRILLADEPTGNLDSQMGDEVMAILHRINREAKTTIAMVTHDPRLAESTDRVVRMFDGRQVQ